MPNRFLALTFALALSAGVAIRGADTLPYDHMHFNAPDPAAAATWYLTNFGAKRGSLTDRVLFGRTIFAFAKVDNAPASAGGAIDHIGISVPDADAKIKELEAAGAKLLTAAAARQGLPKAGFVQDPFGIKIEILQDTELAGFHHIHLRVPDPDATLKWYADNFGGERTKWKGQDALKYSNPPVWLLAEKAAGSAASQGRAIDHLGWAVTNVDAKVTDLAGKKLKVVEPRAVRNLRVGFVEDPAGVRIEMVQGRTEEELVGK